MYTNCHIDQIKYMVHDMTGYFWHLVSHGWHWGDGYVQSFSLMALLVLALWFEPLWSIWASFGFVLLMLKSAHGLVMDQWMDWCQILMDRATHGLSCKLVQVLLLLLVLKWTFLILSTLKLWGFAPDCLGFERQDGSSTWSPARLSPPSRTWPLASARTWPRWPARQPGTCSAHPGRWLGRGGLWDDSLRPEVSCILGTGGLGWWQSLARRRRRKETKRFLVQPCCSGSPSPLCQTLLAKPVWGSELLVGVVIPNLTDEGWKLFPPH